MYFDKGLTTLHKYVLESNKDLYSVYKIKDYIKRHPEDINTGDENAYSALHHMVMTSNVGNVEISLKIIKILLKNKADINAFECNNRTPLMLASRYCDSKSNIETIKLLLEHNAHIDMRDIKGETALFNAVSGDVYNPLSICNLKIRLKVIKLLLKNNANVNAKTQYGETILMRAVKLSENISDIDTLLEILKLLLEYNANINDEDCSYGSTALMYASGCYNNNQKSK